MRPKFGGTLSLPLSWELADEQTADDVVSLMSLMDIALMDAALGLEWFVAAQDEERAIEARMTEAYRAGEHLDWNPRIQALSDAVTDPVRRRHAFIHARTFLFALDTVRNAILSLGKIDGAPDGIADVLERWDREMSEVKHVRDSSHHIDERVRGLARNKEIQPKEIDEDFMKAPAGMVLITESLVGDEISGTTASGELMGVAVRKETLDTAREIAQAAVDAFPTVKPGER